VNRGLAALAAVLAALGLLARSGTVLPPEPAATLATFGRAATPVAAGLLALATLVGAVAAVRGGLGRASWSDPVVAFRGDPAPADDLPLFGAETAAALDRLARDGPGADPADRETVRAAVERAGTTVLAWSEGVDRETARSRYRRGAWTCDPTVAAFCGAAVEVPLRTRIEEALAPEPRFVGRARRTLEELDRLAGSGSDCPDRPPGATIRRGGGHR
jgi:hypothetical protein